MKAISFQQNGTQAEQESCKRVCFFSLDLPSTDEAQSVSGGGKIRHLNQIDGHLCTHLVLYHVRGESNGAIALSSDEHLHFFKEVREFKLKYKQLKVMAAVLINLTDWSEPDVRQRFSRSVIDFLNRFNLDGIDLDYHSNAHYLGNSSGIQLAHHASNTNNSTTPTPISITSLASSLNPTTFLGFGNFKSEHELRLNLIKLIKCLREAFVENFFDRQVRQANEQLQSFSTQTHTRVGGPNTLENQLVEPYLLTITIQGNHDTTTNTGTSNPDFLKQLVNLCDWFNVKSFDYFIFKAYAPFAGPVAPLYPIVYSQFVPILSKLSLSSTLSRLLLFNTPDDQTNDELSRKSSLHSALIPRDKLVMGIPTYARAYRLMFRQTQPNPFNLSLGTFSNETKGSGGGLLTSKEVSDLVLANRKSLDQNNGQVLVDYFDARARVPYLLLDDGYTWISYENTQSVKEKVRFILDNKLAGYMTWNLNNDFFGEDNAHTAEAGVDLATTTIKHKAFPLHEAMLEESLITSMHHQ